MVDKALIEFIKEARRRGFDDYQIREPLLRKGWPSAKVEEAFALLKPKEAECKSRVTIYLDVEVLKKLEKRAKRNLFTLPEQIEDILRRSSIGKTTVKEEKLDDKLVGLFSRKR